MDYHDTIAYSRAVSLSDERLFQVNGDNVFNFCSITGR